MNSIKNKRLGALGIAIKDGFGLYTVPLMIGENAILIGFTTKIIHSFAFVQSFIRSFIHFLMVFDNVVKMFAQNIIYTSFMKLFFLLRFSWTVIWVGQLTESLLDAPDYHLH